MATSRAGFGVAVILALCCVVRSLATAYTVGDTSGWTLGFDYSTWASDKTFTVGDNLVFNYGSTHTVAEVSGSDYKACSATNAITSDSSGSTKIPLKTTGSHYFICGVSSHCSSGMKMAITVTSKSSATPSSGTTNSPASSSSSSSSGTSSRNTPSTNVPETSSSVNLSPFDVVFSSMVAIFILVVS
ncbi:Phytocyanin domain [Dillenia turbinata]|uniref:Phytocyanin domain n=1 Tax=Dillenia turbinata TaxID=194707 RepID=A0AAN8W5D4_9MAGN